MNANTKLHRLHMEQWAVRFQDQAASGLTVRDWCARNNLTVHNYYYWKRILKQEYVDSALPDIVPLLPPAPSGTLQVSAPMPSDGQPVFSDGPHNLHNLCNSLGNSSIHISYQDFSMDLCADISADLLIRVIKAVKHA